MKWLFGLLVLIAAGAAGYWWWDQRETVVIAVPASTGTAVDAVTGTVEILAQADVWVKTEHEGRLAEVPVGIGDTVRSGEMVFRQESERLENQIQEEMVRLKAANARLEVPSQAQFDVQAREREIEGLRVQVELGQAPASRLEDLRRELRKSEARLREETIGREESAGVLRARVRELEYRRSQMSQNSPIDGEVIEIYGIIGDRLNPNSNVVRVVSHERIVEMELNEEDMGGVVVGAPVTLRLASYPDREFKGTVDSLYATANSSEKTRKLIVKVEADPADLVPGLTGEGYLIKGERQNAVRVPRRALIGHSVYVVSNGLIEIREVQPGYLSLNWAEIREGLAAGEVVVLENQDLLREGQAVVAGQP